MPDIQRHLDIWSRLVILMTFIMFVAALFLKGFGHDILLEGGVFLISVKLIMMAYKNSVVSTELTDRFESLQEGLARMEGLLESRSLSGPVKGPPNEAPQPTGAAQRSDDAEPGDRACG